MLTAREILEGLTRIANQWQTLAVVWHILLAVFLAALVWGWRPSRPLAGGLIAVLMASVSILAWVAGNPFNGSVFGLLSLALIVLTLRMPRTTVSLSPPWAVFTGTLLVAFGWIYPHFLQTGSWATYLYAAPFGLVPCPTLSVALGLTLIFNGLGSRAWPLVMAAAGLLYGLFGAFQLGVLIDFVLIGGAITMVIQPLLHTVQRHEVTTTR
jgi:hypothetical protein